jgi:heme exporter protein A
LILVKSATRAPLEDGFMFSAIDLACSRGGHPLFEEVGFALQPGDWLHVQGENGAGKTTLLRTLTGLAAADTGEVRWDGMDIRKHSEAFRRAVLYLGHPPASKDELTPLENLALALALDGLPTEEADLLEALDRVGLRGREHIPVRHLSAGQRRRALLARLLLRPAALWVLDEPFGALDTAAIDLLCHLLDAHLTRGGIAVLTSHQPVPLPGGQELLL